MPDTHLHRADSRPCCQLFDLLNETGRLEEEGSYLPMNREVSERIQIVSHSIRERGTVMTKTRKQLPQRLGLNLVGLGKSVVTLDQRDH